MSHSKRARAWRMVFSAAFVTWTLPAYLLHGQEDPPQPTRRGSVAIEMPGQGAPPAGSAQEDTPRATHGGSPAIDSTRAAAQAGRQMREGTSIKNIAGTFRVTGDRIAFCPEDGTDALPVVENLALERVWRMLEEMGNRPWSVSGTLTEYRGGNYLLIERAVVRGGNAEAAARRLAKPNPLPPRS